MHYIRSNGTDHPARLKIRTPTLANITSVLHSLKGSYIADIPIVFAAIDPCMACMDRVMLIDQSTKKQTMSWEELKEYSLKTPCVTGVRLAAVRGEDRPPGPFGSKALRQVLQVVAGRCFKTEGESVPYSFTPSTIFPMVTRTRTTRPIRACIREMTLEESGSDKRTNPKIIKKFP